MQLIGVFLLVIVVLRHTRLARHSFPERLLAPAGAVIGFLSAVVGSAGPLGAAVFLSLKLPAVAYVASEAVTASLMHITKSIVYGRFALLSPTELLFGFALGISMVLGSWTGRKIIDRITTRQLGILIEVLLVTAAFSLIIG